MNLQALYVDFNSFFASAEQHFRPELRGRALGVLPSLNEYTSCIAASVQAKRFGVKTGTMVKDARRLCPEIIFVEARPTLYVKLHHRLIAAVESCIHVEAVRSIDEMWCRLRGRDQDIDHAIALAQDIKQAIYCSSSSVMTCSIGIAPNRFLAKTASNMHKPDGLVVLRAEELPERLFALELADLNGIGRAMLARLHALGITSVERLCHASAWELRRAWGGIEGERFHAALHGQVLPEQVSQRSTVGHSHVLPPELRNWNSAHAVLHRLTQKAAMRLRRLGYLSMHMQIFVKCRTRDAYKREWTWVQDAKLDATDDTLHLLRVLQTLWQDFPVRASPIAVGMNLRNLCEARNRTADLFTNSPAREKLNRTLDALNQRYGYATLYYGGASQALDAAPVRIAFQHIPDLGVE